MKLFRSLYVFGLVGLLCCANAVFAETVAINVGGEEVVVSGEKIVSQKTAQQLLARVTQVIELFGTKPSRVAAIVEGDFFPDSGRELAVLTWKPRPEAQLAHLRTYNLIILSATSLKHITSAWHLVNPSAVYTAPPMISAKGNVLIIENEFGSRERCFVTLRFRYQPTYEDLYLIGVDQSWFDTAAPLVEPRKASANLLTGKLVVNGKATTAPWLKRQKIALQRCDPYGSINLFKD